jgi:sugar-specific transcriptional regulator TrmB
MNTKNKLFITAHELSEMLQVSEGHAYKLIRMLNKELESKGYIIIAGRVPRKYLEERFYGHGA